MIAMQGKDVSGGIAKGPLCFYPRQNTAAARTCTRGRLEG